MISAISSGLSPSRSNLKVTIFRLCVSSWHSATLSPTLEIWKTFTQVKSVLGQRAWGRIQMNSVVQMLTLRTFSLALAVFSWRERLRTDRRWWRFSERPSWRPPDVELPSLPSLRPEAASDRQLKQKWTHDKEIEYVLQFFVFVFLE